MHRTQRLARLGARPFLAAVALVSALASASVACAQTTYKVTELLIGPKNDIGLYSKGMAINKKGQTAIEYGYSFAGFAAARCTKASCDQIPPLQGEASSATSPSGINDAGYVTGSSVRGFATHAFLFDGVHSVDLGGLPDDGCGGCMLDSFGRDVNNAGDVVGLAYNASGAGRAFLYRGGVMLPLGTLGGDFSEAHAINDKGDIVGVSTSANGSQRGFLYRNGQMSDLGTLGGSHAAAFGVNEMRQIVGCATLEGDGVQRAFFYQHGGMSPLPSLGGNDACALGVNRNGLAVGYATLEGDTESRAVLWDGVQAVDLTSRLEPKAAKQWTLTEARAINDKGQIVVSGLHKGLSRAALLTPLPAVQ